MNQLVRWRRKLACIVLAATACTLPDVRVRPGTQTGTHEGRSGRDAGQSGLADAGDDAAGRRADGGSDEKPSASGSSGKPSEADGGNASGRGGHTERSAVAGQTGSAGNGEAAQAPNEDAGPEAIATVLHEYQAFLGAQKEAVDTICSCFQEHGFAHRMACEADFGLFQPGKTACIESIVRREAEHAIPRMQCRRSVFESYRDCVESEFECSAPTDDAGVLMDCKALLDLGIERCPPSPDWLLAQLNVCYDLAEAYWAYVDVVYARASRVCRCFSALGYDSLAACRLGEGIVYSEFAPLETCFFDLEDDEGSNPDEKASARAYFACDQMRMTEYATCVETASTCDMSAALQCKNVYRIERAGCRNQAHFLRDPYELCGQ